MRSRTPLIVAVIGALAVVTAALIPAVRDLLLRPDHPEALLYRGCVRDSVTNLPVKDAQVIALGYTDIAPIRTDSYGAFRLSLPVSRPGQAASIRLQVTHREYREFNQLLDLSKSEVETSLLLEPLADPTPPPVERTTPEALKPTWPTTFADVTSAELQVSDIDDLMNVSVNGNPVIQAAYGETPPWVSIAQLLRKGPNKLEVVIQNGNYGGCGGTLTLRLNRCLHPDYRWVWSRQENQAPNVVCFQQVKTLNLD